MLFNSFEFLLFFPIVTVLYFLLPYKYRWSMLLAASCFFYMYFKAIYILILFFTIIIDYYAGILIEKAPNDKKKLYLVLSIISNVGVLAIFKYYNFINDNISGLCNLFGNTNPIPSLSILLPIGLSFHTFQAMSYTIEVYRGKQVAEKNFILYSLYVMFYPQLVAGPIERPQNILNQFKKKYDFDYDRITSGLRLMAWGLFKKVVIADRLALFVNKVYDSPYEYHGIPLISATVCFAFQIYCDFSGYSDIAIGSARVMGIYLMKNFNNPYSATSISDFWRRWHISLSTWFKDYVYIPLGGNRVAKWRMSYNLIIIFLLSGIWHGASWNYVIWGVLHALFSVFSIVFTPLRLFAKRMLGLNDNNSLFLNLIRVSWVFFLVTLAWVFFRATDLKSSVYILSNMHIDVFSQLKQILTNLDFSREKLLYLGQSSLQFFLAIFFVMILILVQNIYQNAERLEDVMVKYKPVVKWSVYYFMILSIVVAGIFGKEQFVYFQF